MKKTFFLSAFVAAIFVAGSVADAQTATLAPDDATLDPAGGLVALTACVQYGGEPSALGLSLELPAGWSFVAVTGPNLPQIAPTASAAGTIEFAFTSVPPARADFSVTVAYPAKLAHASIRSTVIIRSNGRLLTLNPEIVTFSRRGPGRPARNLER